MQLKHLKSGSDVRGTAIELANDPVTLTDEAVSAIASAFVIWLSDKKGKPDLKIAVGHDSRLSAERIENAVVSALKGCGTDIYLCGLCSTPSMFMMTKYPDVKVDGSIMITASHHPYNKNGLKFFTEDGGLESFEIEKLLDMAEQGATRKGHTSRVFKRDFMQLYCDMLIDKVRSATASRLPLAGLKIVVDAGNGAGGFFAERVLKPLGADTTGSQFLEPDGNFFNHIPNPEDKTAMQAISQCVIKEDADLGIIFDTDVDRSAIVLKGGKEINRNKLIALISNVMLSEQAGATIVTDSVTSDGLAEYIEKLGGVHHRFKRGYKNVINEAIRLNNEGKNAVLAIETSGHAAFKENYFLDDGAYLVVRLLIKMSQLKAEGKTFENLLLDLKCPKEEREVRLKFLTKDFTSYGKMLIDNLTNFAASNDALTLAKYNYEGVRANVDYARGWFLVRMSVHDPIMPINIESDKVGGARLIAKLLYSFISSFSGIETTELKLLAEV